MNILLPTSWFPNRFEPRHGNFVAAFAEALAAEHRVHVITVCEQGGGGAGAKSFEVVESVTGQGRPYSVTTVYYPFSRYRLLRLYHRTRAWRMATATLPFAPGIIHAHVLIDGGIVAARLSRRLSLPFLVSCHSSRFLHPEAGGRGIDLWLARRAARRAARILPVSPALERAMRARGISGRYSVLPNLVNTTTFHPPARLAADRPFTFLHVSDFSPNKRVVELLSAFNVLLEGAGRPVVLHLAGDGDPGPALHHADRLSLPSGSVLHSGPHSPEAIGDLMRSADCFVLNSGFETQSVVVLEALLCGLPVVTTAVGGAADILATDDSFGATVPAGDGLALVAALRTALAYGSPTLQERRERAARAAAHYGSRATLRKLGEIYREMLP